MRAPARFARRFFDAGIPTLAAALSFYTLLSLAPLVAILLWLTTALYPGAQDEFFHQIGLLAGPQVASTARLIVANAQRDPGIGSTAALLGTLTLLLGASVVFAQLQSALNRVFESDARQLGGALSWLRKRLFSFGMALGVGFLLVVSMAVHAALSLVMAWLPDLMPVLVGLSSFVLYAAVFAAMYRFLPDRAVHGRVALLGGALTAALFLAGRWLIGLYLGRATLGSAYGPAGGLVVMLVWLYYCALVFLSGALITAMCDESVGKREAATAPPARAVAS